MNNTKNYLKFILLAFTAFLLQVPTAAATTVLGDSNPANFMVTSSNYVASGGEFFVSLTATQAATAKALNININTWQFVPSIKLTLRNATGALLAQGTITAGATGVRSVAIPDVSLTAGQSYIMGIAVQSGYLKPFQKAPQYVGRNDAASTYTSLAPNLNEAAGTNAGNIPQVWATGDLAKVHGDLSQITLVGAGTKIDNNTGNYTFAGHRHMHHRFTDLENATSALPSSNTKAGWKAHLDGIYPILNATDLNPQAQQSGATIELTGGPTVSGKWLKRQLTQAIATQFPDNYALRNFNLSDNDGIASARDSIYVSFYLQTFADDNTGKFFRTFFKDSPLYPTTSNFYPAKAAYSNGFTWRTEGSNDGWLVGYSDQTFSMDGQWNRIELMLDFSNDRYAFLVNGTLITDLSRGYMGWVTGQLGVGTKHYYSLLGNTVAPFAEDGHHLGWAQPHMDFSLRRIEVADSANWSSKTKSVIQPIKSWANDNIEFIVNQGDFANLQNKHVFYVDGTDAIYIGPL